MLVLHINWVDGALRLWAEALRAYADLPRRDAGGVATATTTAAHPFAVSPAELLQRLLDADLIEPGAVDEPTIIRLALPVSGSTPCPSDRLMSLAAEIDQPAVVALEQVEIPAVTLRNDSAIAAVLQLEDRGPAGEVAFGHSLPFWIAVVRFVVELLEDQRFIPTLMHSSGAGTLRAAWRPWLNDESARNRLAALLAAMPPVVRAVSAADGPAEPWPILCEAIEALCDATVRLALVDADFIEAVHGRDPAADPQVAWLAGLLDRADAVPASTPVATEAWHGDMLRDVRTWLARLEDAERTRPFRLCLRLSEPSPAGEAETWALSFHLLLEGDTPVMVDTQRVWEASPAAQVIDGHRIDRPQELLLGELGRASQIYPGIESALSEAHPTGIALSTREAAEFLREDREVLEESGFAVEVPEWWGSRSSRIGVRLQIDAPDEPETGTGTPQAPVVGSAQLGLNSLVRYRWQLAVGDEALTAEQLRAIADSAAPLIWIAGRWVENTGGFATAVKRIDGAEGGEVTLREAIRMAQGDGARGASDTGLPVLGMDAHGWVSRVLDFAASEDPLHIDRVEQPPSFLGTLRPYQKTGLSWLAFLERFGFGACLADDMGLGKTIQLIALLLLERQMQPEVGTTLLVVPTSLIENWSRELHRFAPSLTAHVHHGPQRLTGDPFVEAADATDVLITTYALVARDRETLAARSWWRVALDEAQFIKNPPTRQASAIRSLQTDRRVALTGTPVENRLSELWSIMEFCNPGYLGPAEVFRRRCAVPIERHRDREQAEALRKLVRPFVLRRLKTDPTVISDLPACVETKEFATLTGEQAGLYQAVVDDLLASVNDTEGIQRRGRVLAALTRLKQICNHPAQLSDADSEESAATGRSLSSRSGKSRRLMEMLEELLAAGGSALVFTQYRRMGHLLSAMIRQDLDCEAQFMHGGTSRARRQEMIDRFQRGDGSSPIFVLSLKTGGVGLNLTAANHVFHFDRWWNPAVENQATDRAFRIGQTRQVHVHKFVCAGTLEERIDEMIEQKTELAENVISAGEQWITELSSRRLEEILRLRATAMEVEG